MKPLTPAQITGLTRLIQQTRERELDCDECQRDLAEFAEQKQTGITGSELIDRMEQHLSVCPECTETFVALKKILEM